jgi:ribosome biogenesis GTPase A
MNYQWYPGHMTKARRMMQEDIKLIDLVIELVDARVPFSSRNPDIDELGKNKSRLILLNKTDLADEKKTAQWAEYFKNKGYFVAKLDARSKSGIKTVSSMIAEACREKTERDRRRGIKNRPVRAMIVGIPNVGKSTFINTFAGKACAKTGNKPGVTKGKQWVRLNKDVELLDTPGILWPKFDDQMVGLRLAVTGAIRDEILQVQDLALWLIAHVMQNYPGLLSARYQISEEVTDGLSEDVSLASDGNLSAAEQGAIYLLGEIAQVRGCRLKGGDPDYEKAAMLVIDDFRSGRLGRITLEDPEQGAVLCGIQK